jgi:hypothetical protein
VPAILRAGASPGSTNPGFAEGPLTIVRAEVFAGSEVREDAAFDNGLGVALRFASLDFFLDAMSVPRLTDFFRVLGFGGRRHIAFLFCRWQFGIDAQ